MTTFVLAWLGLSLLFASVVSAGINVLKYRAKIRDLEEQVAIKDVQLFNQECVLRSRTIVRPVYLNGITELN